MVANIVFMEYDCEKILSLKYLLGLMVNIKGKSKACVIVTYHRNIITIFALYANMLNSRLHFQFYSLLVLFVYGYGVYM